jgi:uncharacterized membrane protein YsdA (DUF1294 family)
MSRQTATISGGALLGWALLLIAPSLAVWRLLPTLTAQIISAWVLLVSVGTFALYAWDKRRAQQGGQREPESRLHLLELLGGWPGAFLAQRLVRHKTTKKSFQFIFWVIVLLHQYVAIDAFLGWRLLGLLTNRS